MSEKKPISYSAYGKYHTCPKLYDYHYNHKIRPETTSSALLFGGATDKALNEMALGAGQAKAMSAAKEELERIFREKVVIESKDFDHELITEDTQEILVSKLRETGWAGNSPESLANTLFDQITLGNSLSESQDKALRILVFFSFYEKIRLIVKAFEDYLLPQVEEIVSTQKNVKRGILDFEAKFKGIDGVVICDNKTTTWAYAENSVQTSVQLASYGAEKACYIVFNKTVKKNRTKVCSVCGNDGTGKRHKTCNAEIERMGGVDRCGGEWTETISPEIDVQIIIDDVSPHVREMTEQAFQETEKLIESGVFPRNLDGCGKQFGKPCVYFNLCWNNDMTGLKKKE